LSPIAVLLVLLVVAYVGGLWASARHSRSFGSPSGAEYALLGILLGPHVLGTLSQGVLITFEPICLVALCWIALGYGLDCGMNGRVRARVGPMLLGMLLTALVMLAVAAVIYMLSDGQAPADRAVMALAVGLVSAETTRYGVRRVGERFGAAGPLYRLLNELAAADDAPALIALPLLYAALQGPQHGTAAGLTSYGVFAASLVAAAGMGAIAGWLIARTDARMERWTILLGSVWLLAGAAELIGASAMGVCFAAGVALSATCPEADVVRRSVARTEGPVLLPALLLAGAHLNPLDAQGLGLVLIATVARIGANFCIGVALAFGKLGGRMQSPMWLGLSMQSSGPLSLVVGFAVALRMGGQVGNAVLACAIAGTLLGELVGPYALRRALRGAGELEADRMPALSRGVS
jgi:Kef-type K+ transport system membrane component KefB